MKKRMGILAVWLIGLFATASYYVPVFRLQDVRVTGNPGVHSAEIASMLEAQPGVNLLRIDLGSWADRIVALPAVRHARTYVTLGGAAVARVELERPVILVDTEPVAGLTLDGWVLPLSEHRPEEHAPVITGIGGLPKYYERLTDAGAVTALAFLRRWLDQDDERIRRLVEIEVSPDGEVSIFLWPDRLRVRLGRGQWNEKIERLWAVLKRYPAMAETIDLRFDGQVVQVS